MSEVKEGQYYQHFKGNIYKVIRVDSESTNELRDGQMCYYLGAEGKVDFTAASDIKRLEPVVFCQGKDNRVWVRSLSNFNEVITAGNKEFPVESNYSRLKRFSRIYEHDIQDEHA